MYLQALYQIEGVEYAAVMFCEQQMSLHNILEQWKFSYFRIVVWPKLMTLWFDRKNCQA
jgi:hypothetical protein